MNKNYPFDPAGFNSSEGPLFSDFIRECEADFNKEYYPHCANYLEGNYRVMHLIKHSFLDSGLFFGRKSAWSLDESLKLDENSIDQTVYALGSSCDRDQPLYLILNDMLEDNYFILFYRKDSDELSEAEIRGQTVPNRFKENYID